MTIFDYYIDDISDKAFEYYVDKMYNIFNFENIEKKEVRRTDIKEKMNKKAGFQIMSEVFSY